MVVEALYHAEEEEVVEAEVVEAEAPLSSCVGTASATVTRAGSSPHRQ